MVTSLGRYTNPMDYKAIGNRLRSAREKAGLTQAEVAEKLKISTGAYGHYETGRSEPNLESLNLLADLFKTTVDTLLGREQPSLVKELEAYYEVKAVGPTVNMPVYTMEQGENCFHGMPLADPPFRAVELQWVQEDIANYLLVHVDDDDHSMEDKIPAGCLVLVHRQQEIVSGQTAVIRLADGKIVIRRVRLIGDTLVLIPNNPRYREEECALSTVVICGRIRKAIVDL
jgi:repressor LexA